VSRSGVGAFPIRPLETRDEFQACVALQEEVWGEGFSERVPVAILMVSRRLGGVVAGAWDEEGRLAGFVFGMTGWREGRPYHWSDMLAVRPDQRGSGLALRLKAYQRELLLEMEVGQAHWTFDPLESRNAWVNLGRLGAVAREYVEDMYGQSDSPLHRGIGTDRLVVTWELASPRVVDRMDREVPPPGPGVLEGVSRALGFGEKGGLLHPVPASPSAEARSLRVPIPADLQSLKARDPELALAWRMAVREALAPRLHRGWEVRELIRAGNVSEYLVVLKEEE
jgi:predicted GNAT superfamily acetyltransferase